MAKAPPAAPKKREISVVERRLKSGSIFATGTGDIPVKEPGRWTLRIANSDVRNGRIREMEHDKQWQFVEEADLSVSPYEIGFRVMDGKIVRGQHGAEVLMKMETSDFRAVQMEKDKETRRNTFGSAATKQAVISAASREPDGAQGAAFLDRTIADVKLIDSRESVSLED